MINFSQYWGEYGWIAAIIGLFGVLLAIQRFREWIRLKKKVPKSKGAPFSQEPFSFAPTPSLFSLEENPVSDALLVVGEVEDHLKRLEETLIVKKSDIDGRMAELKNQARELNDRYVALFRNRERIGAVLQQLQRNKSHSDTL